MKRTFSFFSKRNAFLCFLLTGLFFLLGNNVEAQERARDNTNPHAAIANDFGVTAYPFGTFNREEAIEVLEGILNPIKPLIGHGATSAQIRKYNYVNAVLTDIQGYSIAVEISLLTRLKETRTGAKVGGSNTLVGNLPDTQFANLYNEVVNELQ